METKIKPIKSLEELDSLALGSKVEVVDPYYGRYRCLQKQTMIFGGKTKEDYSFLRGRDFGIPEFSMDIDELTVRKGDIRFDEKGILHAQSWMICGLTEISTGYQEKLKIIQMGETQ